MSVGKHTTVQLEAIGTLVRTSIVHGGFLVAEFRDEHGSPHTDEAKANAQLFVGAGALLAALKRLSHVATWDDETDRAEFDAAMADAEAAIVAVEGGVA
ncbi:hypothetical protein [Roseateles chitosanitabidus]|uniref:hypothetical protein n=1 Tax=Roseateles chitosanitabidus TaxID=65048 RepID=UPI000836576F|nr:hypothetical protein [Roseateles chitosanitabidus]